MDTPAIRKWQRALETVLKGYLADKYPGEMATYMRFRDKVGPHCAYCKSAAKLMFKSEAVECRDFLNRFQRDDWDGYIENS